MYSLVEIDVPLTPNNLSKRTQSKPGRGEIDKKGRLLRMLVPLKEEGKKEVRKEMTPPHTHVYSSRRQNRS